MNLERNIDKVLTLSTGHVTKKVANRLDAAKYNDDPELLVIGFEYGWILSTGNLRGCEREGIELDECLVTLGKLAEDNDCDYIMLDCDVNVIKGLQDYEW